MKDKIYAYITEITRPDFAGLELLGLRLAKFQEDLWKRRKVAAEEHA